MPLWVSGGSFLRCSAAPERGEEIGGEDPPRLLQAVGKWETRETRNERPEVILASYWHCAVGWKLYYVATWQDNRRAQCLREVGQGGLCLGGP